MFPPIYQLVAASAPATALLGTNPVRFWPFGQAQLNAQGVMQTPYAVWQAAYGSPQNFINQRPTEDQLGTQVDVYADSATAARNVAEAIRDAVEGDAYVVAWRGESIDENRSEEHTSELQSLMRISYAVFCLKKKKTRQLVLI